MGIVSEWLACFLLMLKGYRLLYWRYRTKVGEIDLIMRRKKLVIFVEVKARKNKEVAAYSVHSRNQERVIRAAKWFLHAHPHYGNFDFRFDAVLVSCYVLPHHIPHAFSAT